MSAARYQRLARLAAETARTVGEAIDVDAIGIVKRKAGRANFATAADHAAEEAIIARLREAEPDIPVLAEESYVRGAERGERLWAVDPIDGTLNFSRSLPFYCVSIAYIEDGRARAGAIHAPRTDETFVAYEGGGAKLNGIPLAVSKVRRASEAFVVTGLPFKGTRPGTRFVLLNQTCARLRVVGSAALEMAYVAAGRFDLFVHGSLGPWDIAAGALMVREAGGIAVSLRTGEEAAWDEREVILGPAPLVRDALRAMPGLIRRKS